MDIKYDVNDDRTLRLGQRAFEFDAAASLSPQDRAELERERNALFLCAEALAKRMRLPLTVQPRSSCRDLHDYITRALRIDCENLARARDRGFHLSKEQRLECLERVDGYRHVTAADILEEVEQGAQGIQAVERAALKYRSFPLPARARGLVPAPKSRPKHAARPRERASRRHASRASASGDDGEPEPPALEAGKRYALSCAGCGAVFTAARPHARTCSPRCRRRQHMQGRSFADDDLLRLGDIARALVIAGTLSPVDALSLVVCPTSRVRAALDRTRVAA